MPPMDRTEAIARLKAHEAELRRRIEASALQVF